MVRTIVPLLLALPLAGCGLGLWNSAPEVAVRPIDNGAVETGSGGAQALAAGRAAMRGGNAMAAMAAFRAAQRDPATAAEATNGLGVAWATLGRHDLAEQAFLEAVAIAPQDRRFVANLERTLTQTPMPAMAAMASPARTAAVTAPIPRPFRQLTGAVRAREPGHGLTRVSRTEVRIGAAGAAPRPPSPAVATPEAAPGQPVIRVALPRAGDRVYPLRVALPARTSAATGEVYPMRVALRPTRASAYPLRVRLPTQRAEGE